MKKLVAAILFCAVCSSVQANAQTYTTTTTTCCTTVIASGSCCTVSVPSSNGYAETVAKWAVELQLRNWLGKKPEDLTRADIKAARAKLDVLCKWAKEQVENKVFAQAYLDWASGVKSTLDDASVKLDHDEIAKALLLHGLPTLPDGAK